MLNYKVMKVGFGRNNPDLSCFHLISKSDRHSAPNGPAAFLAAPAEFLFSGIRQGRNPWQEEGDVSVGALLTVLC